MSLYDNIQFCIYFFSTNIGFVEHTELCIRKSKKLVMEKSQVNEKYVLTLVENSDATLSVRRMDIPSSEVPIAELEAMVDNPNRTVYDMSSYFYSVFSPKIKAFVQIPFDMRSVIPAICGHSFFKYFYGCKVNVLNRYLGRQTVFFC